MIDALVVGLGNPGAQYARTRHNVGEECVALLARRHGTSLRAGRDHALTGEITLADHRVVLAFPITYMNESGRAVRALLKRHRIDDMGGLVVVHDELDLPPGTVRVKVGGGLAGNNGLRSITQHLHTQDYVRVRIGIGKPTSSDRGAQHVLSRVPPTERELLDTAVAEAADAVEAIVVDGVDAAMQRFNGR
ncbi:MAG: aminoacyl-tRNA hydrolase [Ilumatobacteraceae bacterium]